MCAHAYSCSRHIHRVLEVCLLRGANRACLSRTRGCVVADLWTCSSKRHSRSQEPGPGLPESTRFLSLSFVPSSSTVSLSRFTENARSSSEERRVVDHRYGGVEARKWPTIGCRILLAGKRLRRASRASRVSQGDSPRVISSRSRFT